MKKITAIALSVLMMLSLAACGSSKAAEDEPAITRSTASTEVTEAAQEPAETESTLKVPTFAVNGVEVVPGTEFNAETLPEALSVYEAPSCAIAGSDNTYSYDGFEIVAMDDGKTETVYSICLLEPTAATAEGLAVGDTLEDAVALYGDGYTHEGSAYVYQYGDGLMLSIIAQNDTIQSIEFRSEI